ncbi:hypothetical protein [Haloferula sp.]|uniref:hypothetical protein n=1 Tax=Haloferula sp. TaxID=2497595 RepID=UPI003C70EB3B
MMTVISLRNTALALSALSMSACDKQRSPVALGDGPHPVEVIVAHSGELAGQTLSVQGDYGGSISMSCEYDPSAPDARREVCFELLSQLRPEVSMVVSGHVPISEERYPDDPSAAFRYYHSQNPGDGERSLTVTGVMGEDGVLRITDS